MQRNKTFLAGKENLTNRRKCGSISHIPIRWCGGIGRHQGLKIPCRKKRTGSSPVTSTISSIHKGFDFMNTRFFSFCFRLSFRLIRYVPSKVCALLFFVMQTTVSGDIPPIHLFLCLLCNARKMRFQAVQHILHNDNR